MLLPLNTDKFTNIVQSESNLNMPEKLISSYNANYKPNYKDMLLSVCTKPYQYAEDNSIPIYDLNFSFLDSIKFNSEINILNWLKTNKLDNKKIDSVTYLSSVILFNSETNEIGSARADSILTKPLLNYLTSSSSIG
jgi:hypothetical protein